MTIDRNAVVRTIDEQIRAFEDEILRLRSLRSQATQSAVVTPIRRPTLLSMQVIRSYSGNGNYMVHLYDIESQDTCQCGDFINRGYRLNGCKHIREARARYKAATSR